MTCLELELMFQLNWMETAEEIDDLFLGDAEVCFFMWYVSMLLN
jgi:hypothetical protein